MHPAERYAGPDLDELSTFLTVAAAGSLSEAARRLGLPKSTVSRRLSRTEEKLGVQLIHRTTRRFSLTEDGIAYRERISQAFATLDEANAALREQQETPRGHLRITAPVDLALAELGPLVAEFTARYPQTTVEMVLTERVLDLIGEGIDLAVRAAPILPDSTLVARRIGVVESHLAASPSYLDAHGRPRFVDDLRHHRFVLRSAFQGAATLALEGPDGDERVEVIAAVSASDFSFVHRATCAGGGIGVLPSFLAAPEIEAGRLERVLPDYRLGLGNLFVVHPGGRLLPAKVRAFREFLIAHFEGKVSKGEAGGSSEAAAQATKKEPGRRSAQRRSKAPPRRK